MDYQTKLSEIYNNPDQYQEEEILKSIQDYAGEETVGFYALNDPLEQILLEYHRHLQVERTSNVPIHRIYLHLAERTTAYSKKEQYYAKALQWNPADLDILFSYCTYLVKRNHLQKLKDCLSGMYDFLYTRADLARFYRFYGYFFIESKQPEAAYCFYTQSQIYYPTKEGEDSLSFLKSIPGIDYEDKDKLSEILKEYEMILSPPFENIGILRQLSMNFMQNQDLEQAMIYQNLAMDILNNE